MKAWQWLAIGAAVAVVMWLNLRGGTVTGVAPSSATTTPQAPTVGQLLNLQIAGGISGSHGGAGASLLSLLAPTGATTVSPGVTKFDASKWALLAPPSSATPASAPDTAAPPTTSKVGVVGGTTHLL